MKEICCKIEFFLLQTNSSIKMSIWSYFDAWSDNQGQVTSKPFSSGNVCPNISLIIEFSVSVIVNMTRVTEYPYGIIVAIFAIFYLSDNQNSQRSMLKPLTIYILMFFFCNISSSKKMLNIVSWKSINSGFLLCFIFQTSTEVRYLNQKGLYCQHH